MKHITRTQLGVAFAAAAMLSAVPGTAQSDQQADAQIIVEAPRSAPLQANRGPYSSAPVALTIVRMSVLYGDLDLKQPDQAEQLMYRIERVAQDACRQLDRIHPFSSDPNCVSQAVAKARPLAVATISAASAR